MDKCREAFEQLPEIKDSLSENIVFVGNKYTTANEGFYDLVNWLNGALYTWQSRQAEVDGLNDNHLAYIDKVIAMESDYLKKIEEKDKRIEELESAIKHLSGAIHKSISYEHDLFDKGWNECAERVIEDIYRLTGIGKSERGEHE